MSRVEELLAEIERLLGAGRALSAGDVERVLELCREALAHEPREPAVKARLHAAAAAALLQRFAGDRGENLELAREHAQRALDAMLPDEWTLRARALRLLAESYRWRRGGDPRQNLRRAADLVQRALDAGGDDLAPTDRAEMRVAATGIETELAALDHEWLKEEPSLPEVRAEDEPDRGGEIEMAEGGPSPERLELAPRRAVLRRGAEPLSAGDAEEGAAAAGEHRRAPAGPAPVVSTGFATADDSAALPADQPLEPGRRYLFWFAIAPTRLPGAIEAGMPVPLPDDLPAEADLDVVLFGYPGGLEIDPAADRARLRLRPGGAEPARLDFPVRAPAEPGPRRLRCSVFHRGLLLQSREVTAWVGEEPPRGIRALSATVDFTLSSRLDPAALASQPRHAVSLLVNDDAEGVHGVRLWSDAGEGEPIKLESSIPDGVLGNLIGSARGALRLASWGNEDEWARNLPYFYEDPPPRNRLRADLVSFARRGYRLFTRAMPDLAGGGPEADALHARLRRPAYVQVVHRESGSADPVLLPAAMFYDRVGFDTGADPADYRLCPAFERALDAGADLAAEPCFLGDCPHAGEPETVVCPSGFWGFRHRLGLPASAGEGADAALDAGDLAFDTAPELAVGVSTDPGLPRRAGHEQTVQALLPGLGWNRAASRRDLLDLLEHRQPHVVYLYCHGGVAVDLPYLQVGPPTERGLTPDQLYTVLWRGPRPVVIINGCHTTALSPELAQQFVTAFVGRSQAAGVIGTEITIFEPLACAFGEELLARFLAGERLGEAVRLARLKLLAAGNPLGLVYVPYALPGLQLVRRAA